MDGAGSAADLAFAKAWSGFCFAEMLYVPGNHDVGDAIAVNPWQPVADERLAAWRNAFGPDWWCRDIGGWRLIGLDAMLFGTGHPQEEIQFHWLQQALATAHPVAVFMHKPLFINTPNEGPRGYWTVRPEPRARLMAMFANAKVRMVASGHLHIWRQLEHAGINYVWGPASSFVVGSSQEPLGGDRRLGAVLHDFTADAVVSTFVRPDGLVDLLIEPVQHVIYPPPSASPPAE